MKGRALRASSIAIVITLPASALADPGGDTARADALFHSAKSIRDAGQFADACPLFAESNRLAPGVGTLLYLGECNERTGRTASAWTAFENAEKLARVRDDRRAEIAHARAAALAPVLSGLTLAVPAPLAAEGPEVLLDGARVPPDEWNAAVAVDPGEHTVTVRAPGRPARSLRLLVDAGNRRAVSLADPVPPASAVPGPATAVPAAPEPQPTPAAADPGATRRWIGIGLLGAGALGVGLGATILLNRDQSSPPQSCTPQPRDTGAAIAAGVAFAAGGAALIAGLALTVTTPGKGTVGLVAAPVLVGGGAGAVVRTTF